MIDHHEQHCRQILIDELEAVSPSLATWAFAEFDAGLTAAEVDRLRLMAGGDVLAQLIDRSRDLAEGVQFDDSGAKIAGKFMGGNGGLLSRGTIHKAGLVQLTLNDIKRLKAGKEG